MDLSCNTNGATGRKAIPTLLSAGKNTKGNTVSPLGHDSTRREHYWEKTSVSCATLHDKVLCKENVKPLLVARPQQEATAQHTLGHLQQDAVAGRGASSCEQRSPLRDISPGARADLNAPVKRKAEPVDGLPSKKLSPDFRREGVSAGNKNLTLDRGQSHVHGSPKGITVSFGVKQPPGVSWRVARAIEFGMADDHDWFVQHSDDEILPRIERLLEETPKHSAEAARVFAQAHQEWVFALQYHLYRKTGLEADTLVVIYHNLARLMAGWHRYREAATLLMLLVGQLEHHPDHKKVMRSKTLMSDAFRHDCMNELMTQWLHLNNQDHALCLNVLKNNSDVREAVAKNLGISLPQCFASLAVNLRCSYPRMLENAMVDHVNPEVKDDENAPWRSNDVLVLRAAKGSIDKRERMVPYLLDQVVQEINLEEGFMRVLWDPDF
ncbi:ribosome maturation factor RimM [Elysia marginata]|uniref:Ribosome maturation factor RimM n=1 Tax=Elysia marginata TaxID=1093978 RepID=A0AAV4EVY1_9GAST|nr:ribosome maturation factor RimM [Elysia marginata]